MIKIFSAWLILTAGVALPFILAGWPERDAFLLALICTPLSLAVLYVAHRRRQAVRSAKSCSAARA